MALGYLDDSKLTAIANAIRGKTGGSASMTVDEMPTEIGSIGGSSWTLLASREYTFTTDPSTTTTQIDTISLPSSSVYDSGIIVASIARKKNFVKQASEHRGTDTFFINQNKANGGSDTLTSSANRAIWNYFTNSSNSWVANIGGISTAGGLFINTITSAGVLEVSVRRINSFGSLIGEYTFDVYALKWPDDSIPFSS